MVRYSLNSGIILLFQIRFFFLLCEVIKKLIMFLAYLGKINFEALRFKLYVTSSVVFHLKVVS